MVENMVVNEHVPKERLVKSTSLSANQILWVNLKFDRIVKKYDRDKYVRHFLLEPVALFAVGKLTGRDSLRDLSVILGLP